VRARSAGVGQKRRWERFPTNPGPDRVGDPTTGRRNAMGKDAYTLWPKLTPHWLTKEIDRAGDVLKARKEKLREAARKLSVTEADPKTPEGVRKMQREVVRWEQYLDDLKLLRDKRQMVTRLRVVALRPAPGIFSRTTRQLGLSNHKVKILGEVGAWYHVETEDSERGYIHKIQLQFVRPIELSSEPGKPAEQVSEKDAEVGGVRDTAIWSD
jgi:hypothetical protein